MLIGSHDTEKSVFIVAEIGNNHEGNPDVAKALIEKAAESGVNAVKFQTFVADRLVSKLESDRLKQLKKFELSYKTFEDLAQTAKSNGLLFLSTPFDIKSAEFLNPLVPAFKIASGDNTFFPLIERIIEFEKPILISTGLANLDLIKDILFRNTRFAESRGLSLSLALLHCVTSYPAPVESANLNALRGLSELGTEIGYSDHTMGITACPIAVALGARIIEKHFTLSNTYSSFRDHALSADPAQMRELVRRIRETELLLGDGVKKVEQVEETYLKSARRSIVAARPIPKGTVIHKEDLQWVRPARGLEPGKEDILVGKAALRDLLEGEAIQLADV